MSTDKIDAAIAAKAGAKTPEPTRVFTIPLASGRSVDVRISLECTVLDILELTAKIAGQLPVGIAQEKAGPASRLVLPT